MAFTDNSTGGRVIKEGISLIKLVLADTCKVGDPIGFDDTSGAWEVADADGKILMAFIAGEECLVSGRTITVYRKAIVSGFTDATLGDPVYLGNTEATYTAYPESWIHQQVGTCISDTEAYLEPQYNALFSYDQQGVGWGGYVRAVLTDASVTQSNQIWGGLRVDMKAESGSTIASDAYGIYVFAQLLKAPVGSSSLLRLEDGCASSCGVDSFIVFVTSQADAPDYFFAFGVDTEGNGAWDLTKNCTTSAGQMKLKFPTGDRYILLHSSSG